MFIIGTILIIVAYIFFQTLLYEIEQQQRSLRQNNTLSGSSNVSLLNLFPETILDTWLSESLPADSPWKAPNPNHLPSSAKKKRGEGAIVDKPPPSLKLVPTLKPPPFETVPTLNLPSDPRSTFYETSTLKPLMPSNDIGGIERFPIERLQSDMAAAPSAREIFVNSLFRVPPDDRPIVPDWNVVLGSFQHCGDENWESFLIKTEVPFWVRLVLRDSSELLTVSRLKSDPSSSGDKASKSFKMSVETASWFLTHVSTFTLKETYVEHDLDGTDSKNTFFFVSPRLLVHTKIKAKWRTAIIRHFNEEGMNATFVDRDRIQVARRYFKRVTDT